jgi:uncharacterized Zn-finger protein
MARTAPTKAPSKAAKTPAARKVTPPVAAASPGDPAAIPPPEIIVVRSRRVACDGVGGALGHPRVYLEMGEANFVECGYCDRRFVLATGTEGPENEYLAPGVYEGSHGH